jgi:hypothetical protein
MSKTRLCTFGLMKHDISELNLLKAFKVQGQHAISELGASLKPFQELSSVLSSGSGRPRPVSAVFV